MNEYKEMNEQAKERYSRFENSAVRRLFVNTAGNLIKDPLVRQRVKMAYYTWGYWRLLFIKPLSIRRKALLLKRFIQIDWNILHGHHPSEISAIANSIAKRNAWPGEVMIEAGCWNGGSSAKFSILCDMFGYQLGIYDSFEGVEVLSAEDEKNEWDYGGQYAAPEDVVKKNISQYGCSDVCSFHKGWFSETLVAGSLKSPVRLAYIDCDLGKGTREALQGIVASLAVDGEIFSQDFHIDPVRDVLLDPATWKSMGKEFPRVQQLGTHLAQISFCVP